VAKRRILRLSLLLALTMGATFAGARLTKKLATDAAAPSASSSDSPRFSNEQRQAITQLSVRLRQQNAAVPSQAVPGASNAEIITYIAESSEDPEVIAAALSEVESRYSSRSSQKPLPDAALERVLLKHLDAPNPRVAHAALLAARVALMTKDPSDALTRRLANAAAPERPANRRHAALEGLSWLRPDRRSAYVLSALEQALSASEPHLLSLSLLALSQSAPSLAALEPSARERIARRVLELGEHADPGVRGRALLVLAEVAELVPAGARLSTGQQHLLDPHPYVRAQAADLLLRCREPLAIHQLIALVPDMALARYELGGFDELEGQPGVLLHSVPGRKRVAEAALLAILSLSQALPGVAALSLTLGGREQSEAQVLQSAEIARTWYRAEEARIPKQSVAVP